MSVSQQRMGALPWSTSSRLYRSRRRALLTTLAGALALHLSALILEPSRAPAALPANVAPAEADLLIEVEPPPTPPGRNEAGGGSIERGLEKRAEGEVKEHVKAPARVHAAPKPIAPALPPTPSQVADREQPEHGDSEVSPEEDLFALDELLSAAESEQRAPSQIRPRPAWRETTPNPQADLSGMPGKAAVAARNFGSGPGEHGGPGGDGKRTSAGSKNSLPFGGASGAFRGQVCAIPRGTPSIRSLGACQPIKELYTDTFNIPSRAFDLGFPGLPGHDEWFAILYTGAFQVERGGLYEFRLASDDGSILEIDGQLVIDNDGQHGPVSRRGTMDLNAGRHELRLRYFQGPRNLVALLLYVTPPGRGERLFRPQF